MPALIIFVLVFPVRTGPMLRHATASCCHVLIDCQDHHLELTIRDDGRGFPAQYHSGVGLNSMRERAGGWRATKY
jgi:signal transduction histidine kinase